jgi:hypothetical protein
MTTYTRPGTAHELFEMGDIGRCELVRGEIVHKSASPSKRVEVHSAGAPIVRYVGDDEFRDLAVVPGFVLRPAELFRSE